MSENKEQHVSVIEDEQLERLEAVANRLQNGTGRERDEGHKIWLVIKEIRDLGKVEVK